MKLENLEQDHCKLRQEANQLAEEKASQKAVFTKAFDKMKKLHATELVKLEKTITAAAR